MKPIKFLLSLCAVLMVAVGAMGQITSITAPSGLPASICGGATVTPSGVPSIVETVPGSCSVQPLVLQAVNPADNSVVASGSAGTVGSPTAGSVVLPAGPFAPVSANVTFRYAVTSGGLCNTNGTLSALVPFTANTLTIPNGSGMATVSSQICVGGTATITGLSCTTGTLTYFTGPNTTDPTTTFPGVLASAGTFTYYARCVDGTCIGPSAAAIPITVTAGPNPTGSLTIVQACATALPTFSGFTCPSGSTPVLINTATNSLLTAPLTIGTTYSVAGGCRLDAAPNCLTAPANVVNTQNYTPLAQPGMPTTVTINGIVDAASGGGGPSVCATSMLTFAATCPSGGVLKVALSTAPGVALTNGSIAAPAAGGTATYWLTCIIVGAASSCESAPFTTLVTGTIPNPPTGVQANLVICEGDIVTAMMLTRTCATGTLTYFTTPTGPETTTFPGPIPTAGVYTYYPSCVLNGCEDPLPRTGFTVTATAKPNPTGSLTITQACGANLPTFTGFTCPSGSTPILIDAATGLEFTTVVSGTTYSLAGGCKLTASPNCITALANVVNTQNYTHLAVPTTPTAVTVNGTAAAAATTVNVCPTATVTFGAACASGSLKIATSAAPTVALTNGFPAPGVSTVYNVTCIIPGGIGCESGTAAYQVTITPVAPAGPTGAQAAMTVCAGSTVTLSGNLACTTGTLTFFTTETGSATTTFPGVIPSAGTFTYYAACVSAGCASSPRVPFTITASALPNPTGSLTITQACGPNFPTFTGFTCPSGSTPILIDAATGLEFTTVVSGTTYSLAGGCKLTASPNCITALANVVNTQNYTHLAVPTAPTAVTGNGVASPTVCPGGIVNFAATCATGVMKVALTSAPTVALTNPVTTPTMGSPVSYNVTCIIVGGTGCESSAVTVSVTLSNTAPSVPTGITVNGTAVASLGTVCPGSSLNFSSILCNRCAKSGVD